MLHDRTCLMIIVPQRLLLVKLLR